MSDADIQNVAAMERLCTPRPWSEAALRETLALKPTIAFVYAVEPPTTPTRIAGHAIATMTEGSGELLLIAVGPEFRRGGVAKAMLHRILTEWDCRGLKEGWLEVRADNTPAIRLYEAAGFHHSGRRRQYYFDGTDAVLMTRLLNS